MPGWLPLCLGFERSACRAARETAGGRAKRSSWQKCQPRVFLGGGLGLAGCRIGGWVGLGAPSADKAK